MGSLYNRTNAFRNQHEDVKDQPRKLVEKDDVHREPGPVK